MRRNLAGSRRCSSCVGRELIYVGLHFVHHMALMAVAEITVNQMYGNHMSTAKGRSMQ